MSFLGNKSAQDVLNLFLGMKTPRYVPRKCSPESSLLELYSVDTTTSLRLIPRRIRYRSNILQIVGGIVNELREKQHVLCRVVLCFTSLRRFNPTKVEEIQVRPLPRY